MLKHRIRIIIAVLAANLAVSGASAESLRVSGIYPPDSNFPATVELIVIEPLEGDLGQDLEFALFDTLGGVTIRREPWFEVLRPEGLDNAVVEIEAEDGTTYLEPVVADATIRGTVRSELIERTIEPRIRKECTKRDEADKCIEEREIRIECRELTVRVDPRLLMVGADGQQVYSYTVPRTQVQRYCADDSSIPSSLEMANAMIDAMARDIRINIAPAVSSDSVRVMESRSGLQREDRSAFRDAVRLIDSDSDAACRAFAALEEGNPLHLSLLFNLGLCWEASNQLDRAEDYYRRALKVDAEHSYPRRGLNRVQRRQRGEAFVARREGA